MATLPRIQEQNPIFLKFSLVGEGGARRNPNPNSKEVRRKGGRDWGISTAQILEREGSGEGDEIERWLNAVVTKKTRDKKIKGEVGRRATLNLILII